MFQGYMPPQASTYAMPDEKAIMAKAEQTLLDLLQHCDRSQLQQIHDSDSSLDEMIAAHVLDDALRDLRAQKDQLLAQTRQLAEANLQKQPLLTEAKQRLTAIYDEVKKEREQYELNKVKVESLADNAELENVHVLLNVAARQAEEESEKFADELMAKQISVQQFLERFVEQRKLAYLRKIKADKLQELMLKPQPQAAFPPARPPQPGNAMSPMQHY